MDGSHATRLPRFRGDRAGSLGLLTAVSIAVGCGGGGSSPGDPGGGAGANGASSSGAGAPGAGGATGSTGGAGGSATGTGGAGGSACAADMVSVPDTLGGFCIDATEVTNADYSAFLAAVATDPNFQQPAKCAWNASLMPSGMMNAPDFPVVNVDWCDAHAYCAWAGKRLCGRIGGGENPFGEFANASSSQWYAGCSVGGTKAFPYGDAYDPLACNGGDDPTPGLVAVATTPGCIGGYPGIYDMSGNVWEWEDSCEADTGATDLCHARGGAHGNGGMLHQCDYAGFSPQRDFAAGPMGIRCCSP